MAKKRGHFPRNSEKKHGSTICPVCHTDFTKSESGVDCKCTEGVPDYSDRALWLMKEGDKHGQA